MLTDRVEEEVFVWVIAYGPSEAGGRLRLELTAGIGGKLEAEAAGVHPRDQSSVSRCIAPQAAAKNYQIARYAMPRSAVLCIATGS